MSTSPPVTLGVLTIGQAPRPDRLGLEIGAILGASVRIVERGALDGLEPFEIERLAPAPDAEPMVTLLRDGTSVRLRMAAVTPLLQQRIRTLEEQDQVAATLLVCGGDFPTLRHGRPFLQPHDALHGAVSGLVGTGVLAAMIPIEEQDVSIRRSWRRYGREELITVVADPYAGDALDQVRQASVRARSQGAEFLYLECFGYTMEMRDAARAAFGMTSLLARSLAGRMLGEFA